MRPNTTRAVCGLTYAQANDSGSANPAPAKETPMIHPSISRLAILTILSTWTGLAGAQSMPADEGTVARSPLAPASNAFEITIGAGYEQAFGKVATGAPMFTDTATAGGGVQVGLAYRFTPYFGFGVYGTGAQFGRGGQTDSSAQLYSMSGGVQADIHFAPGGRQFDPWISLGTGWRGYWESTNSGTTSMHGLELGKLQVGIDYRISQGLAISPVVGADMSLFLTRNTPGSDSFSNIGGPTINTFLFGGLMGRFDLVGESAPSRTAMR
jgi:hypothetical protein